MLRNSGYSNLQGLRASALRPGRRQRLLWTTPVHEYPASAGRPPPAPAVLDRSHGHLLAVFPTRALLLALSSRLTPAAASAAAPPILNSLSRRPSNRSFLHFRPPVRPLLIRPSMHSFVRYSPLRPLRASFAGFAASSSVFTGSHEAMRGFDHSVLARSVACAGGGGGGKGRVQHVEYASCTLPDRAGAVQTFRRRRVWLRLAVVFGGVLTVVRGRWSVTHHEHGHDDE